MPHNRLLAVAIPTYNRAAILESNIRIMLPELKEHRIPLYISDDSDTSETSEVIAKLRSEYEYIYYTHNNPRLGHDQNFFATLSLSDCDYVWYLGDSIYLKPGHLNEILSVLEKEFDLVFLNSYAGDVGSGAVDNNRKFLIERVWYLTLTGATIYGRKSRELALRAGRDRNWRNFVQLGAILEYCGSQNASLYWYGTPVLGFNKNKRSYWTRNALQVFVSDWCALVRSFPILFSNDEMNTIIRSHAVHMRLFNWKSLVLIRANGGLAASMLRQYKSDFMTACPTNFYLAYLISIIPVSIIRSIVRLGKLLRKSPP